MNPYQRWRQAVYVAGVTVIGLLTVAFLLTLLGCFVGAFGGHSGTSSGY